MEDKNPNNAIRPKNVRPETYKELMQKVGKDGRYQKNVYLILLSIQILVGAATINTVFLFLNTIFSCLEKGVLTEDCENLICSLPEIEWDSFIIENQNQIQTIATSFGNYLCDDKVYLNLVKSFCLIASIIGLIGLAFIGDNFGRRVALLLALGFVSLGSILLGLSSSLTMAAIGLFFVGLGTHSCTVFAICYCCEVFPQQQRQRKIIGLSIAFTIGSFAMTIMYYLVPNWQIATIVFSVIPSFILFFIGWIYVEQTPQFLVKAETESKVLKSLQSFNRIGKINFAIREILEQQDIYSVQNHTLDIEGQFQFVTTPYDLIRFSSLRFSTLTICLMAIVIQVIFFGHLLFLDNFDDIIFGTGIDAYEKSILVRITEITALFLCYFLVHKIRRRQTGVITFTLITGSATILLLGIDEVDPTFCPSGNCFELVLSLILVFVIRFLTVFYLAFFYVYISEIFPVKIQAYGLSIFLAFRSLTELLGPLVMGDVYSSKFSLAIVFCVLGMIAVGISTFLAETYHQNGVQIQIPQIQELKKKWRSQHLQRSTFRKSSLVRSLSQKERKKDSPMVKSQGAD